MTNEQNKNSGASGRSDSEALLSAIEAEMNASFVLAEAEHASEKLAGNEVKKAYWKGELATLHRFRRVLASR